jgi:hypothetical protein
VVCGQLQVSGVYSVDVGPKGPALERFHVIKKKGPFRNIEEGGSVSF